MGSIIKKISVAVNLNADNADLVGIIDTKDSSDISFALVFTAITQPAGTAGRISLLISNDGVNFQDMGGVVVNTIQNKYYVDIANADVGTKFLFVATTDGVNLARFMKLKYVKNGVTVGTMSSAVILQKGVTA